MKKSNKIIRKIGFSILFVTLAAFGFTQPGGPPGDPGSGDVPIGGNAPVGGGLVILTILGAAYGAKKVYDLKNDSSLEE